MTFEIVRMASVKFTLSLSNFSYASRAEARLSRTVALPTSVGEPTNMIVYATCPIDDWSGWQTPRGMFQC